MGGVYYILEVSPYQASPYNYTAVKVSFSGEYTAWWEIFEDIKFCGFYRFATASKTNYLNLIQCNDNNIILNTLFKTLKFILLGGVNCVPP